MILDSFKLHSLMLQISYADRFELWDRAGRIARQMSGIWQGLKLVEVLPQQQTLRGERVQIFTGVDKCNITLQGVKAFDQRRQQQLKQSFDVWTDELALSVLTRVSTRVIFVREFPTLREANAQMRAMKLVRWPAEKVFDQPMDGELNLADILYRFEDEASFALLRIKPERIKYEVELDPDFFEESKLSKEKSRLVIDFDRGLLGEIAAKKFRMEDWFKGFMHVLRRDLEKVIGGES